MLTILPPRPVTDSRTFAKSHTAFAPPMRVSAGLLPNITTRSEARSASENEEACTLSYGLHLLPYMKGSATCSMWVE